MKLKKTEATIITQVISNEEGDKTFEIRKSIPNVNGETAVLIMLYPGLGYRDVLKSDDTTRNLTNHCLELELKELRIVNLFATVCKARLSTRNLQPDIENISYIESIMKEEGASKYKWVICWGSSMQSSMAVKQTKEQLLTSIRKHLPTVKLKQLKVNNLDVQMEAVHPLYLGIRHGNKTWRFDDYEESIVNTFTNSSTNLKETKSSKDNTKASSLKEKVVKNTNSKYIKER